MTIRNKKKSRARKKTTDAKYLGWSECKGLVDGWIPKFSFFVPILGYFILFNDSVVSFLSLELLTGNTEQNPSVSWKVYGLYFGLFLLGTSNIIYNIFKPKILKIGVDRFSYSEKALETFSYADYNYIYEKLGDSNYAPSWEVFKKDFDGHLSANLGHSYVGRKSWREIIFKNEEYLRDLLANVFCYNDGQKRKTLITCVGLSCLGYLLLGIVSASTLVSVLYSFIH